MARRIHDFDPVDRFVAGTVGLPGERTFFLQARAGERLVSVVCEKVQVAALADRLDLLLDELRGRGVDVPPATPPDREPLDEPIDEAFRVGVLTIAWDTRTEEVILEARALRDEEASEEEDEEDEKDDDDPDGPDLLRVRLVPRAVAAFVQRAREIVAAGRPPCPWCGQPLERTGHYCPRKNGNRAN